MGTIRKVLENNRSLQIAEDVGHEYQDKYYLAEWLTRTTLASQVQILASMGVTPKILNQLKEWSGERSVTLRLHSEERCEFDRKVEREVERATKHEREYSGGFKITDKVIDTITEYFWNFDVAWELVAFRGNDVDGQLVIQGRKGKCELMTATDKTPKPKVSVVPEMQCNITWLLQHLSADDQNVEFGINREAATCRTPRRNEEVESAVSFLNGVQRWSAEVHQYFTGRLFATEPNHGLNLGCINANGVFVPVVPLFEKHEEANIGNASERDGVSIVVAGEQLSKVVLPIADVYKFLDQQQKSLEAKHSTVERDLKAGNKLISSQEGNLLVSLLHFKQTNQSFFDGVNFIEDMLRKQIVSAIGKVVTPVDFSNYMRFHNRKVFREIYQPKPFSYHVRRPAHYPEGVLSIEQNLHDGSAAQEIETTVRHSVASRPMKFPLNASTQVSFLGHRYLHSWIDHQFSGQSGSSLTLSARARQFSSFILLVGTIGGADLFLPKFAIIIKDKDDLRLPLLLETFPAAKEFRDAIESLSPEQQRFAKAYRAMQLASTLFGVVTIQIKPQLEKLLNLAADGLAKEIQLTQDLQDLFLQYQIPSDLLGFDESNNPGATDEARLQGVKQNVKAIQDMIQETKDRAIAEAKEKARLLELEEKKQRKLRESESSKRGAKGGKWGKLMKKTASVSRSGYGAHFDGADWSMSSEEKSTKSLGKKRLPPHLMPQGSSMPVELGHLSPGDMPSGGESVAEISAAPPEPQVVETPEETETPQDLKEVDVDDEAEGEDYSKLPAMLDRKLEQMDTEGSLRPTTIKVGPSWRRLAQRSLLGEPYEETMGVHKHKELRVAAFDLLDALSRSGALVIEHASLHVVLASTHCFDKNLMDTLVQDNVNPIEKLERSNLLVATTIQQVDADRLLKPSEVSRASEFSAPMLFGCH